MYTIKRGDEVWRSKRHLLRRTGVRGASVFQSVRCTGLSRGDQACRIKGVRGDEVCRSEAAIRCAGVKRRSDVQD